MKIIKSALVASVALLLVGFAVSFSPSKPLSMIEDINLADVNTPINPSDLKVYFDGRFYFVSFNLESGNELWRTDGTTSELVKELSPGRNGTFFLGSYIEGEYLYFITRTYSGELGFYYIKSGSKTLEAIETSITSINEIKKIDGVLYFLASNGTNEEVYSLGSGNVMQITDHSDYDYSNVYSYTIYNNAVYLIGNFDSVSGVNEYKNGQNNLIDSGKDSYNQLYVSGSALYFSSTNYSSNYQEFYKFDGAVSFSLAGQMEQVWSENIAIYGDNLAVYGRGVGETVEQLYVTSGAGFQIITNFIEDDDPYIEYLGTTQDNLYYTVAQGRPRETTLFQLNGITETEIPFEFNHIVRDYSSEPVSIYDNKVFFWASTDSGDSLNVINGGVVTELYSVDLHYDISAPASNQGIYYYIISKTSGNKELIELDASKQVASHVATVNSRDMNLLSVEDSIFVSTYDNGHVLGKLESNAINQITKNGITGNSNPYKFTEVGSATYFLADNGVDGQGLWFSDGYSTSLIKSFGKEQIYSFVKVDEELVVFPLYIRGGGAVWSVKDGELKEIAHFDYFSGENELVINNGLYFLGQKEVGAEISLFRYHNGQIVAVDNNVRRFYPLDDGVVYEDLAANPYYFDGESSEKLRVNNLPFERVEKTFSVGGRSYIRTFQNYFSTPTLYLFDENTGLQSIENIDFSQFIQMEEWKLADELLLKLRKKGTSEYTFYRVNEGTAEQIDTSMFVSVSEPNLKALGKNRAYFQALEDVSREYKNYFYSDGRIYELGWQSNRYSVASRNLESKEEWVITYNSDENSHFILSNDGSKVEFVTKIEVTAQLNEVKEVAGGVFLQFVEGNRISELAFLEQDGAVTLLNRNKEFNWGDIYSFSKEFLGKGHGKWFFMRGCTVTYGCEPYSMNLNQLPTAKFDSETSYFSGQNVILDAAITEDPDGDILEYNWVQLSGPQIDFDITEGESISFKAPEVDSAQDVVIELTVVDDGYDKDITSKSFKVKPNSAPTISIDAPESAEEGVTVTLDASGTVDAEDEELTFVWSVEAGNVTLSKQTEAITSFKVPSLSSDATATLTLIVTDASGYQSAKSISIELLNKASDDNNDNSGDDDSDGGSGGGSTGLLLLLLLGLVYMRRVSIR